MPADGRCDLIWHLKG